MIKMVMLIMRENDVMDQPRLLVHMLYGKSKDSIMLKLDTNTAETWSALIGTIILRDSNILLVSFSRSIFIDLSYTE